jgi:coenzyme F420 hydrogenase subunit beta
VADIACGDAWERLGRDGLGTSLVIVRTERGREILKGAMKAQYVHLVPAGASEVLQAQPSLLERRKEIFGRLLAMKMFFIPTPHFYGFALFKGWAALPARKKLRTIAGTIRRVLQRRWWRPRAVTFVTEK